MAREMREKEVTTWALIFSSYASGIEVSIKSTPRYKSTSSDLVILQLQRQHTVHGEELPYVLGVPLDSGKYNLRGRYDTKEKLFSEAIMNWWCSFAYSGWVVEKKRLTMNLMQWLIHFKILQTILQHLEMLQIKI